MSKLFLMFILILTSFFVVCQAIAQEHAPSKVRHSETEGKAYKVRATVKKIYREEKKITLKHGKIKGYMPAMTMTFPVSKAALLDNLQEGSKGIFTIFVFKGLPRVIGIKIDKSAIR